MKNTPLIHVLNITKKFKKKTVLDGVTFDIFPGEVTCLIGTSGCGKTTLLKIILGFYSKNSGDIKFDEKYFKNQRIQKSAIGFVSQENSFYNSLTVEENLFFYGRMYRVPKKEIKKRVDYLLNLVKLSNDKKKLAENLSGGMKRRLEFAISLIHNPKILVLDEPFTGLDAQIKNSLWELINTIKHMDMAIILTTHLLDSAEKNADRAIILEKGKIKRNLDLNSLRKKYSKGFLESELLIGLK